MYIERFESRISSLGEACCGCGACAACCPKGCIVMESDAYGFLRPSIDGDACIDCGACDAICPVLNPPTDDIVENAFWAKADNAALLDRSSSGGVFGLLACDVLSRGGAVAGATWTDDCRELRHVVVEHKDDLDPLMRSKYVQSSIGREVYEKMREALCAGRPVLFCGTACQIAGVRSYLGKLADSDLFLGIDVICHGVPSPELWQRWVNYVGAREQGKIYEVNFRSKTTGWSSFSVMYKYVTEKDDASRFFASKFSDDWYMKAFLKNASLRPSCLRCPFKRRCGSDVTLGDYWGILRQHPEAPVEGGVSAVVCNTCKGAKSISLISGFMDSGVSSFDKVVTGNPAIVRPVTPYADREAFMTAVAEGMPIPDMMSRWDFELTFRQRLASKAKGAVKKLLGRA